VGRWSPPEVRCSMELVMGLAGVLAGLLAAGFGAGAAVALVR
jgi:hypothetical protein